MNLEKAKKRIAHQVKKGFKGYPLVSIAYYGETEALATKVVIQFIGAEGEMPQAQEFESQSEIREDETIQSVLVKIIERANASSVEQVDGVGVIAG